MITSPYSKSSNSSAFNPILQKFYKVICAIIVSKTMCGIFLFFFQLRFIHNFVEKNNFSELLNHWKLNISKIIYLQKFLHPVLKILSTQISWRVFFFEKNFFSGLGAFFTTEKALIWTPFFPTNKFYTFSQSWLFNFNILLKTCFRNLFRKTEKLPVSL